VVAISCPPIPFTAAEVRREAFLWRLAGAFQALMDEARNPCALKGGTALRFQTELSRPSTGLDFEGDRPVSVRKTLVKAMAAAARDRRTRCPPPAGLNGNTRIPSPWWTR